MPSQRVLAYPAIDDDIAPMTKSDAQSGQPPVVLVHGLCGTPDWGLLEQTLNQQGITTAAVDLRGVDGLYTNGDIKIYAGELDSFIQEEFPGQQVDIIAHSMGGLISRYYVTSDDYTGNVRKLITLGTPHSGSEWARLVILSQGDLSNLSLVVPIVDQFAETEYACFTEWYHPAFEQLVPGSTFLRSLNATPLPESLEVHTLIGWDNRYGWLKPGDSFVSLSSARLGDYPLYRTEDTHLTYSDNPTTVEMVVNLLMSPIYLPSSLPSFQWWPVMSVEGDYYIPDVVNKADFLENNVTSDFGFRNRDTLYHFAIDIRTVDPQGHITRGSPVFAVADGVVKFVNEDKENGGCNANVAIYHPNLGVYTQYFHLNPIYVANGQNVVATQQIGLSGPPANCGDPHLDFRVRHTLENTKRASTYLNPLTFYETLNLDTPHVSDLRYRNDATRGYVFLDSGGIQSVGSQDLWIGFQVSTRDRDIDEVSLWLDEDLQPLYHFNYYAGNKHENATMPFVSTETVNTYSATAGYVSTGSLEAGQPSRDWFFYHLYSPEDQEMQKRLEDGQLHTIHIRAYDVFGNMDEVSFQIELVQ
jgi:murein DD-endopeptidase MepM/ murein hydrolase activator NlpD